MGEWKEYLTSAEFARVAVGALCGAIIAAIALFGTLRKADVGERRARVEGRAVAVEEGRQERAAGEYVRSLNEDLRAEVGRLRTDLSACRDSQRASQEELTEIRVTLRVLQIENEALRRRVDELAAMIEQEREA